MRQTQLGAALSAGACDPALTTLYGASALEAARGRYQTILDKFQSAFGREAEGLFSAPGRTEIGGNHTDHQLGRVLAASVSLDVAAAAAPNGGGIIRVHSEGFRPVEISLEDLEGPRAGERNTSAALVRGVAARCRELGFPVEGFDAMLQSDVPGGSGLSSSAAYEVLLAGIINRFFCGGRLSTVELAQVGQYAENRYFGKPCGLMDQTASAVGGVVALDFRTPADPQVERLNFDLRQAGYALCILDSGADHADLTAEYAAVTGEMGSVAAFFQREALAQVDEAEFFEELLPLRIAAGDRAVMRSMHFFTETRRAVEEAQALKQGDMDRFLALVNESGRSSSLYLQNVVHAGSTRRQELALTLALCDHCLAGQGAFRVHGGGFGGTAQAFVPLDLVDEFKCRMEKVLGAGRCHVLSLRQAGFVEVSCG